MDPSFITYYSRVKHYDGHCLVQQCTSILVVRLAANQLTDWLTSVIHQQRIFNRRTKQRLLVPLRLRRSTAKSLRLLSSASIFSIDLGVLLVLPTGPRLV
jgi:hypothetical protein